MSVAGARESSDLFPEYSRRGENGKVYRTAIDDTSFSPEVKAKVRQALSQFACCVPLM